MPMDKPRVTPKDFVLWAGAMATLYGGVFAFIALIFSYISKAFPNPITEGYYYYNSYSSDVSYEMASLIVLTPVFMILMRMIRRDIARDPSRNEIWVRRWALFLTLFLAGATMVIDLIVLLNTFLQGEELTTGFMLKVLTVLLVAGAGFLHFLADLRGYWDREQSRARMINYGVGVLVLISVVAGFFIVGTPPQLRKEKQDAQRIQDLQNIQWQIVNYWQQKESLPASLADLNDPISNAVIPTDPVTKQAYTYKRTSPLDFQLCATFAMPSDGIPSDAQVMPTEPSSIKNLSATDNWKHGTGEQCFDRSIDPQRYPPYSKTR